MKLHEKRIGELIPKLEIPKTITTEVGKAVWIADYASMHKTKEIFREWAIAIVKENKKEIKRVMEYIPGMMGEIDDILSIVSGFFFVNEFLIKRLEITEEDLK